MSLHSNRLGVAIAQSPYATDAGGEIAALRQLLDRVELQGVSVASRSAALRPEIAAAGQQARTPTRPPPHLATTS